MDDSDARSDSSNDFVLDMPTTVSQDDRMSRKVWEDLAQYDAEIDEFERKLGIKKGRKSLPKAFREDGLEDLLDGVSNESPKTEDDAKKRKNVYDDWLSSKRRKELPKADERKHKALGNFGEEIITHAGTGGRMSALDLGRINYRGDEVDDEVEFDEIDDEDETDDDMEVNDDSFSGFGSGTEDDATISAQPKKENPYVAPQTNNVVAKYVPPSLRRSSASEDETRSRLRKQIQGQINRLTDANILSIVQAIEAIYRNNARGDVTEILTDAILAQICKPESLPDQFFVLTGGFAAAIYRIMGSSFGSHIVRRIVETFADGYKHASGEMSEESSIRKEASNAIALLTELYVFEVVSCQIIFNYLERLLDDLSELNVELLLRICRMAGRLLRKDDPQALKHVSAVLGKAVSKVGFANVSARTKFMVETIDDLRNSKPKAKGMDSAIVSEHVLRMKKRLGELRWQSRRLDGLAPMGMSLDDVESSDSRGKWWLVGASVPVVSRDEAAGTKGRAPATTRRAGGDNNSTDEEDMDIVLPDYSKKARAQGLNNTAQIAIFTAIMSATDHEHGYRQYMELRLKKDDQVEIARVLVQCVGSELQYNNYYALVAGHACANGRVKFALQDQLWRIFRGLGESLFGEEADEEETADTERMRDARRLKNVARFYASLVTDGALGIGILKPLSLPKLNLRARCFVERFMIRLLLGCKATGLKEDALVQRIFGAVREFPSLAADTRWFLEKRVRRSKWIKAKDAKRLDRLREKAQSVVEAAAVGDGE
ncbi:hypothetical protein RJ55_01905 [Drechmeria coniospora]|nr:hypothetical protein RJ55_01905 [Drechmeria coniospora]